MSPIQKNIKLYRIAAAMFALLLLTTSESLAQSATIQFSFSAYTVGEAGGAKSVSVKRSGNTTSVVSVDYSTSNGTAIAGLDYFAVAGTLTFNSGETIKTFSVPIIDDLLNENNETVILTLSNPSGGAVLGSPGTATLIILDDDPAPNLSINDITVTEGNTGSTVDAVFTINLSAESGRTVFVDYGVGNGTASAGSDFLPISGTLSFLPGEVSKTVTVTVIGDNLNEADETFNVVLSNIVNAGVTKSIGIGTILNDDPAPTLSINDLSVVEGNSGTTNADFTVSLTAASGQTITVNYATADGTASAGSDYVASSGTVTFYPGETSKVISVAVNGDTTFEPDETFAVNLSNPNVGSITRSKGSCTILNDDVMPTISISGVSLLEGNSGTSNAVFTVALSTPSSQTVTVNYATANGTAVAGTDYVAASGTLTFLPGETSKSVTVLVNGNTIYQPDKTFFVNLTAPANATIGTAQATGTILNDDVCPTITVGPASLPSGNVGNAYTQTLTASGGTAPYALTVSAGSLPAGLSLGSGTLSGTPTATGTSTFTVTATDVNGCVGSANYTLVINQIVSLSINDISVTEFNKDQANAVFTVTLSAASTRTVTVNYATANGTAVAGTDYTATSGMLTFAPGTTSQTISVLVKGDRKKETNETFSVNLSGSTNSTISDATGICTIVNDDGLPRIHINNESIAEGNAGTKQMVFTVHISKKWSAPVTVDYATADGSAQAGSDYVATSGTLTFAAGENKKTISVTINGDTMYEGDENFFVNLSNPTNAKLGDDKARGTIRDDDPKPKNSTSTLAGSFEGQIDLKEAAVQVPAEFTLSQNYPNPFNPSTTIRYTLPNTATIKLQIYNALGELVTTLVDREQAAGTYQFQWQANLPSGVYFYRLVAGNFVETKRMILMK